MPQMNGSKIRSLRQARGIKSGVFAERVGISLQHLVNIEGSGSVCSIEVAARMAAQLEVDSSELLAVDSDAGTGPKPTHPKKQKPPPPPPPPADDSLDGAAWAS